MITASHLEHLSVESLKQQLRTLNLAEKDRKPDLIQRILVSYTAEVVTGHSAMLQNIPPGQLVTVETSSTAAAGNVNEEPTTVATTGSLSEVAVTGTARVYRTDDWAGCYR